MSKIRVEVKSEVLGNSVFWEGPAERVAEIRNLVALRLAELVARDGRARTSGMWRVSTVDEGES